MKRFNIILIIFALLPSLFVSAQVKKSKTTTAVSKDLILSKEALKDKIKGGWAGQTIGVAFGGPTEFKFNGTMIQDYQPIEYKEGWVKKFMIEWPGLYDDIYMDLAFVEVLERVGLDAPVDSFANALAHSKFELWHANQAGRYNLLNGIKAPMSGYWTNNPHADDLDFQIEADFSGLMSPGMPNAGVELADKIGHIMTYGDGWYGGVFVGSMYSLAFTSSDINYIVTEALKAIPKESTFYQCVSDAIKWHKMYPKDWKQSWLELQKKWSSDIGCPKGVFNPFNIDAKMNSAYVVLGLLYGNGDYTRTLEIATRCGLDSDCNPSTAGGILGTVLGYDRIPQKWKSGLKDAEDIHFKYTTMSLNDVYAIGYKHALEMIKRNGGNTSGDKVLIKTQTPKTVRFEQSFKGLYPISKNVVVNESKTSNEIKFSFKGNGFSVTGTTNKTRGGYPDYTFETELYVDGKKISDVNLPTSFTTRRYDLFWKYELENKNHDVRIVIKNPDNKYVIKLGEIIAYSDKPNVVVY